MKINNKLPLVSVIMPVYNAGRFLVPAIESILKQSYQKFELIIVNDNSTDNSLDIIKKYKKLYPDKIKIVKSKKTLNHGGDSCANLGIEKAKGKYIARMDADDIAYKTRLEKQINFLQNNQNIFLVGTKAKIINNKGEIIGEKKIFEDHENIYYQFFNVHPMIHPSVMFRNENKGEKFYKNKFSANNDYYTFFNLLVNGKKFANLNENLLKYRLHGNNDTYFHMKEKLWNTIKIRAEIFLRYNYSVDYKQIVIFITHLLIALLIPEKLLKTTYLYARGLKRINFKLKLPKKPLRIALKPGFLS